MGKAQDIIKKHVGNPEGIIGLLDDFVYRSAVHWLVWQLDRAILREQQALKTYEQVGDQKTVNYLQSEIKKLEALRDELNEDASPLPTEEDVIEVIDNRYMATRIEEV